MFLRGYDAWKTRLPDENACDCCPKCGGGMYLTPTGWACDECGEYDREPDPDYLRELREDARRYED